MVGAFAALKWRLVSSRIRAASGGTKAWIVLGWCVAAVFLAVIVWGLAALRSDPVLANTLMATLFTIQLVGWVLGPLVAFGVDETVDSGKFALLPLTTGTVLIGAAIALSSSWALLPVALVCSAGQLLLCVVVSRAASAAMSGLMSGRRGRDLGMVIGLMLFLAYFGFSLILNQTASSAAAAGHASTFGAGAAAVSGALAYGPNGALAAIPFFLAGQHWARFGIAIGTALLAIALAWWWWSATLRRSLTTAPSTTEGSAPSVAIAAAGLPVANSVRGMIALVIARDRILSWRDPMRRIPWLVLATLALLWPFLVIKAHGSLYGVAFPALMIGLQTGNQYGVEGTGLWLHMVAFADSARARGEALGHAIFTAAPGTVIVVVAVFFQAYLRRDLALVPAALGVCLALLLGGIAVTGYLSARMPYAVRQSRKSMFANSIPGQKGRTLVASLAGMGGGIVIAVPAVVLLVLSVTGSSAWGWPALVVGPVCGGVAVVAMSKLTASTYLAQTPEILAVVAIGDRS
jgi:ABC-2 type transport system permease protein